MKSRQQRFLVGSLCIFPVSYLLLISAGWEMALAFLIAFIVMEVLMPRLHWAIVYSVFLVVGIVLSTTIPQQSIVFTDTGTMYVAKDMYFVSPFLHEKPYESVPNKNGTLRVNDVPEHWNVDVEYRIKDEAMSSMSTHDWLRLKKATTEGIALPKSIFTSQGYMQQPETEEYLKAVFPFVTLRVNVRYVK